MNAPGTAGTSTPALYNELGSTCIRTIDVHVLYVMLGSAVRLGVDDVMLPVQVLRVRK